MQIKAVNNAIVQNDFKNIYENNKELIYNFKNKTIFVTGATGLIGGFFIRSILWASRQSKLNIKIVALVRDLEKASSYFRTELNKKQIKFVVQDITTPVKYSGKVDYILHCASNTASKSFVNYPVESLDVALAGTKNILNFAKSKHIEGMVYLSSMEVYGELEPDRGLTKESDLGYVDILRPRSSYQTGKRTAESYCSYYAKEYGVPVKIARLAQTISPTVDYHDMRVFAYFARCVVEKQNIILNTPGEVIRSFCYITDTVSAILTLLTKGQNGEPYNVGCENAIAKIKDIARMLVDKNPAISLEFNISNSEIYPTTTNWQLSASKLNDLGWCAQVTLEEMFNRVIDSFYKQCLNKQCSQRKETLIQKIFSITNHGGNKEVILGGLKFRIPLKAFNNIYIPLYQKIIGVQNNKIVFSNYMGSGYGCNSKYITEALLNKNQNLDIVWIVKPELIEKVKNEMPECVRIVPYKSRKSFNELATAKVWVDNYHKISYIKRGLVKTNKQYYIQTWHGSLGIKKIERNVDCLTENKGWLSTAIQNSKMTDYWISNSDFESNVYKESFWNVKNIKLLGHPRNDIFFRSDRDTIKQKVCDILDLDINRKIVFYVPSFREDCGLRYYDIDYELLYKSLINKFGGEWQCVIRLHPRVKSYSKILTANNKFVIDASDYSDIQELLFSSDVVISDYSSCMFDFMLTRKPVFVYANDLNLYNAERGFYYPLESTPFPVAHDNAELVNNILNFDEEKYKTDVETFLKDKGCIEDGHASERVADLIEGIINEKTEG